MKKYGLIGCGMMGQEHIRNVQLIEGAEVTQLFDPDAEMLSQAQALTEHAATSSSLSDLVQDSSLDAILIASPNYLHVQQLKEIAAERTIPILCEKPLFVSPEEESDLLRLQRNYAAPIWVAMEYRYMPPLAEFIARTDDAVGQIEMLTLREHRYPFLEKVGNWNRFNKNTGGTLVEKCCHFFDLMRLILKSEPLRVMASGAQRVNHTNELYGGQKPDIWDLAYVIFDFESGARAMLELCMFAEGTIWNEEISAVGAVGKLECKIPGPPRFWPRDSGQQPRPQIIVAPRNPINPSIMEIDMDETVSAAGDHHGSTFYQHKKFFDLVCGKLAEPEVSLADGIMAVKMGLAAQESAHSHKAVSINPVLEAV